MRYMQDIFLFCYMQAINILGHKQGIFLMCSIQAINIFRS